MAFGQLTLYGTRFGTGIPIIAPESGQGRRESKFTSSLSAHSSWTLPASSRHLVFPLDIGRACKAGWNSGRGTYNSKELFLLVHSIS